ncbi:MAG TPA: 3-oxoadipyl-CoA thiolase [Chthoniobacteraceae bacterium]|nr:3-oxoadipyl-CoA thiolase [Chthoniobacteraceae bacterium]
MNKVYLCDFVRTPIGRYGGALATVRADDLAALPIREMARRHKGLNGSLDEVYLGCANQAGEDNRNVARMALLLAGLPETVPGITVNRLCASGLDAVVAAARAIGTGEIDVAIAGGAESMTRAPFVMAKPGKAFDRAVETYDTTLGWRFVNERLHERYGTDSMPETGENVAEVFGIPREAQDAFALRSQKRVEAARKDGWWCRQIMPVTLHLPKAKTVVVDRDEYPRPGSTLETLAALRPVVRPGGTVTAGNASGINDGAAALLLASQAGVEKLGLKPFARVVGAAASGVAPRVMGMGPVSAIEKLLFRLNWTPGEVDVIELNEAFASQAIACLRQLGIAEEADHVNPFGGAIALGHPLGMSGARIAGNAALALAHFGARRALASMCVGVGQGVAVAFEAVD